MLSKKKQEYFKNLLTQRLNELLEDANKTLADMTDQKSIFRTFVAIALHSF